MARIIVYENDSYVTELSWPVIPRAGEHLRIIKDAAYAEYIVERVVHTAIDGEFAIVLYVRGVEPNR